MKITIKRKDGIKQRYNTKNRQIYKIFAGKKTGLGSRDAQGFSTNGQFYGYYETTKDAAIKAFKKDHHNYTIYNILTPRRIKT